VSRHCLHLFFLHKIVSIGSGYNCIDSDNDGCVSLVDFPLELIIEVLGEVITFGVRFCEEY
jgi:hypothetical protein